MYTIHTMVVTGFRVM